MWDDAQNDMFSTPLQSDLYVDSLFSDCPQQYQAFPNADPPILCDVDSHWGGVRRLRYDAVFVEKSHWDAESCLGREHEDVLTN